MTFTPEHPIASATTPNHGAPPGTVECTVSNSVATVRLNRPERRNAISRALMTDLADALDRIDRDPSVRVVILTGTGNDFCVGRDHASAPSTRIVRGKCPVDDRASLRAASAVIERLIAMRVPTIASIRGGCAGGGLSLALACDLRIAAESAVFNSAFVAVGFPGDLALPWLLTRVVGTARAREIMLLPEKLTSASAFELGLLTEAIDDNTLDTRVGILARRFVAAAPLAVQGAKLNLDAATTRPLAEYLGDEIDRLIAVASSKDAEEARVAFLEKRTPRFVGR
ncbi:enoyl-CoA hydratase/isomerase family protein [Rhodococcus indonesiensis]|uniref:enoyl-CoA hydratase/isomerase family protein n=1 Tax=Rhodococcus indonesiensis TaxID=3055869 RepID=UPI0039F696AD